MRETASRLALLSLILALSVLIALALGPVRLGPERVLRALAGGADLEARSIVLGIRAPRAALAALVGAGLSLAGAALQALLRNPLAEPSVLGVSGGAALGAVGALLLGWAAAAGWALPLAAFAGAIGAVAVVLQIAERGGAGLDTRTLLLAGVVVGAFFNALIMLLLTFGSAETFRSAIYWMMGSLGGADRDSVLVLAAWLAPGAILLLTLGRPLNLLSVGEDTARFLGVRVEAVKRVIYLTASLLVAATVAVAGAIGFVGLIVPHAVRIAWGSDHRKLLPAAALAGASFLVLADTVARTAAAPAEIPVGVITALVGVPLFVVLLTRRSRRAGVGTRGPGP